MRGLVEVVVSFHAGPRQGKLLDRITQVAMIERLDGRRFVATFHLAANRRGFGTLALLIETLGGKRSTTITVDGHPEMGLLVKAMAQCAGPYAYSIGRCGFQYERGVPARCRACPLFDTEFAEEQLAAYYARGASDSPPE